ncbi:MAG: biopolymer transport protein ExbD/TolR [bacterium]|nr:MAG: biopolymer transport protein ExbD/TolR [bacterium]
MAQMDSDPGKAAVRRDSVIQIRRPKKQGGVRIDMTPMVDVAFLLLIFFMVTTVFRQPLAMEINMPEPDAQVKVPEQNVLTLFVDRADKLSYRLGTSPVAPLSWTDLMRVFEEETRRNPELIILVKIHRLARYDSMVEMMDTLEDARMQRFSVVPLPDEDERLLPAGR